VLIPSETGLAMRTIFAVLFVSIISLGGPVQAGPNDIAMLTPAKADRLVVLKGERRLVLMRGVRVPWGVIRKAPRGGKGTLKPPKEPIPSITG
jgi:hypothetical protein